MKDKIEVGDYIRTKDGIIGKVLEDEDIVEDGVYIDTTFLNDYADETNFVKYEDIKKHSFNIIDLIEEGDYVNGFLIDYINLDCKVPFLRSERPYREATTWYKDLIEKGKDYNMCLHFKQEDIKSIVTKEQFKIVEYEV